MSNETILTEEKLQSDQASVESYLKYVQKRRSIRKLTSGPVPEETMRAILEAGRWSPSSANTQPVRMVVVKERHQELWDFIEQTLRAKLQGAQLERALGRRIRHWRRADQRTRDIDVTHHPGGNYTVQSRDPGW